MSSTSEQRREFEAMLRASRELTQSEPELDVPAEAKLWAALTPGWIEPLASVAGFPGMNTEQGQHLFQHMAELGLVSAYAASDPTDPPLGSPYYVMNAAARAEVLRPFVSNGASAMNQMLAQGSERRSRSPIIQALRGPSGGISHDGPQALLRVMTQIAYRILRPEPAAQVPEEVKRWRWLAGWATEPDRLTDEFNKIVSEAAKQGDVERIQLWIETARSFAAILEYALDARLSVAIAQAGRSIELLKRLQMDFRHLATFHRREELINAVGALLDGSDDDWGLHFIGGGGVGKTMVIRYITCLLSGITTSPCASDPNPFAQTAVAAISRIDFDYLVLDYPRLHPGLLLNWLADDLRRAGNPQAEVYFDKATELFEQAQRELQAEGYQSTRRSTTHPLVIEGVARYIDGLNLLGKRPLLVLDTCEELAKAGPETGPDSPLEETFRLLCALHDGPNTLLDERLTGGGCTSLRVIFSGRRLLANSGGRGLHAWSSPQSDLRERRWLRLHHVRGFTEQEAQTFLEHQHVPPHLVSAVINASKPDPGIGLDIVTDAPGGPPDSERCSPFQLSMYMAWALEQPPPEPSTLLSAAGGQYVELRIIGRMEDRDVVAALPIVATLGHLDQKALQRALDVDNERATRIFSTLLKQEWIGTHRSGSGEDRRIADVSPGVRDRMITHFLQQGQPDRETLERAAEHLREVTLDGNLEELDWSDYDAAVRVLQHDVKGKSWWDNLVCRLLANRDPEWIQELINRLAGADGAAARRDPTAGPEAPPQNLLRPFVLFTQMNLLRRQRDTEHLVQLAGRWSEIVDELARGSSTDIRQYREAVAGQIATHLFTRAPLEPSQAAHF